MENIIAEKEALLKELNSKIKTIGSSEAPKETKATAIAPLQAQATQLKVEIAELKVELKAKGKETATIEKQNIEIEKQAEKEQIKQNKKVEKGEATTINGVYFEPTYEVIATNKKVLGGQYNGKK